MAEDSSVTGSRSGAGDSGAEVRCDRCGRIFDEIDRLLDGRDPQGRARCLECLDDDPPPSPPNTASTEGLRRVGVRELRNQVAAVVRRAAAGERIIVTVDGRPTAQLGPLTAGATPTLADLAAAGLVEAPRATPPADPTPRDVPADVRLDRVLEELRGR